MRPADEIEQLLDRLEDHTSAAFDETTLRDMFGAQDEALRIPAAHPWRDIGREIMSSRIMKLAAAAVLIIAVLLLVRHLTSRDTMVTPDHTDQPVAGGPEGVHAPTIEEDERLRLAREENVAQELFTKADTPGLLRLLDTGLDQTKITAAGYLGKIGDQSAVPALQRFADRWRGPAQENPFRKSIEQIQNAPPKQEKTGSQGQSQEQTLPVSPAPEIDGSRILVRVTDKSTGEPIPRARIQFWAGGDPHIHVADDRGVLIIDLSASIPSYLVISILQEGYIRQDVTLRDLSWEKLPRTVQFSLEKGTVVGGVVRDGDGAPVGGATVESYISEQQQFDQPHVNVSVVQTTDAQGRWRSAHVPAGVSRLWFNVHHPDFADGGFAMPGDLKLDDLRAEQAVMVLNKGITITGRVIDAAHKPIAGARLLAGQDYSSRDWTQTDATGHFELPPLRALNRPFLLTVQAPAFAPQRRESLSKKGLAPAEFVLQPAKVLIGRVVDLADRPVEGARVDSEEWSGYRTVEWHANTDSKGMFVWDYPPADAIWIRVSKPGYREIMREVIANDQEQTFVMAEPVTIKGSVTDSQTGEMIKRFKLTPGAHWSEGYHRSMWQTSEGWVKRFTEGQYSYAFDGDGWAYAVHVEADGYLPAESRFVRADEREATINIALTKGQGPSGFVFDANAAPVAGAEVFWQRTVAIRHGQGVETDTIYPVKTDSDGHLAFKPENRDDPFVAICDWGAGVASYENFARDGVITLRPWARVQGDLWIGTMPAADQQLQLVGRRLPEGISVYGDEATTDEHGRFVFERVYPGQYTLYNRTYEVLPGQTVELHLGGTGRTVKGELRLPTSSDASVWVDLRLVTLRAPVPLDKLPRPAGYERMSLDEVWQWQQRFYPSPEGKAYIAGLEKTYPQSVTSLPVTMDGSRTFHVDNVEPGVYVLMGVVRPPSANTDSGPGEVIDRLWYPVEIPPFTSAEDLDTPLDIGVLAALPGKLKAGDPAPDFDMPMIGSGRVRSGDYGGNVLLVTFLSSANLDSDTLQDLKGVYEHFRGDPRYVQVSLLFTANPLRDKKACDEAQWVWPIGFLQRHECREVTEYCYEDMSAPWNILIDPRGNIVTVGLSGEALTKAIEETLRASQ